MTSSFKNLPILKKELIKKEKRKRQQIYNTIELLADLNTIIDFCSKDLIKILINSSILAYKINSNNSAVSFEISLNDIFDSFLLTPNNLQKILENHKITKKFAFFSLNDFQDQSIFKNASTFETLAENFKFIEKNKNFQFYFSDEVIFIFAQSILNAKNRFKTPIVTPEIFFITIMESENSAASSLIKQITKGKNEWYILRYKLIKSIYVEESKIRQCVPRSLHYFAYLLKTKLSGLELSRLIDLDLLPLAVEYFRTKVVRKALDQNILIEIKRDVRFSAYLRKRKYSLS